MVIRREQMQAFSEARRVQFISEMCQHLRRYFPGEMSVLDDATLRDKVIQGIQRASEYEPYSEQDCCHFLNLSAALGWNFDSETENSWMVTTLTDPEIEEPSRRLALLVEECLYRTNASLSAKDER